MQPVQLASWSTSAARGREGLLPSRQPKPAGGRRRRVHLPDHGGRVPAVGEPEARGQARAPSMWGTRALHARPLPFFVILFVHLYVGQLGRAGVRYGHVGPCVAVGQSQSTSECGPVNVRRLAGLPRVRERGRTKTKTIYRENSLYAATV